MALGIKSALDLRSVAKTREDFKKQLQYLQKYADNNVIKIKIDNATNNINNINGIGSQVKAVGDSARNASDGFKTLGSSMGVLGGFYTKWLGVTTLINSSINAIKGGIQEISSIDASNVRIAMISGDTVENVKKMNGEIMGVSKNLGSLYSETANGMESWMRSGLDKNQSLKNLETTTKLSTIAGVNNKEMADSLIIVKNAYDLSSSALEGYASKVALLDNTSATSSEKINKGMMYSAESFKTMGVDMDTALSMITNFSEKSAKSGESIGRGFVSMMTNFHKIQEGSKNGNKEETDAVNQLETLLSKKGLALRKNKDEWLDLGTVIKSIQRNMGKFTEVEKSQLAFKIGGKENMEMTLSTLNNMTRIDELNGKLKSDSGAKALNDSFSKNIDSIEFKLNNLKNTTTEMWMKLIDSNTIKTTIDGITSLINAMSQLDGKTVLAGITFVTTLKLMSASMKTFTIISSFTKAGEAVGLFQKMMVAMRAESAIASLSMGTMASGAVGLGACFRVLGASIMTSVKASLAFMMTSLGLVLGALALVIGGVTLAFAKHAKAQAEMKTRVDENKASVEGLTEALKEMDKTGNAEGVKESLKPIEEKQVEYKKALAKKKEFVDEMNKIKEQGLSGETDAGGQNVEETRIRYLSSKIKESEKSIESMNDEFKQSGIIVDEVTGKIKNISDANEKMATSVPVATKSYEESKVALGGIEESLAKVNGLTELSQDLTSELLTKYPEAEGHLGSVASAQEFLNGKVKDQGEIQRSAFAIMQGDNEEFYKSKLMADDNWKESVRSNLRAMGASTEQANAFDFNSFKSLNSMKDGILNSFGKGVGSWLSGFVNTSLSSYGIDLDNFKSAGEAKLAILNAIDQEVAKVNANMGASVSMAQIANKTKGMIGIKGTAGETLGNAMIDKANNEIKEYGWKLQELAINRQRVNTSLGGFGGNFSGFSPSSSAGISTSGDGGGSYTPSGGDDDKSKKDRERKEKEAKKDVANMEQLSDRYSTLNNIIKRVTNSLADLNIEKENANDKEKLVLIEREILLLNEQTQAHKNLLAEQLKYKAEAQAMLRGEGFNIDSNGLVANEKERLDAWVSYANAQTGVYKEQAIAHVEGINKVLKEYTESNNNTIPKAMQDIKDLKNSEIKARTEIADIIKKQINEEKEAKLKLIDDVKSKYNKENSDSDKQDELNKEKKALEELQNLRASKIRDSSALGRAMLKDLDNSIKEKQDQINKMVLDNAREEQNNLLDEQKKKIEENSENSIKKLDTDAQILGVTLDKNLLDVFKKANLETDSIISKFKSMGLADISKLSVFNEQGKKAIESPQLMTYKVDDISRGVNSSTINNSNVSPITISMPITVNGKPTDSEYKEIESKFGGMIKKGVDVLREELYQKNLRYGN